MPNNLIGPTSPCFQGGLALEDSKIHFNNIFVGTTDPNYNRGFTSILYMNKYINDIPIRGTTSPKGEIIIIIIQK